ncbi:MAG: response regulator transcription factor [Betaproteobacteria bacterium]|nr:response regulator transcription factor [Betaproteobacteria bacterium]
MNRKQTLIIADDNPRERNFLGEIFAAQTPVQAEDGAEALALCDGVEQPWLITDIQMPKMNGIELAHLLWARQPDARIVFWTQYDDEMYVRALAGIIPPETVYGYVLKNNPTTVLEKAAAAVFADCQCWIDPQVRPVQARTHRHNASISDAEFEVLIDIALGLTDNAIARRRYLSRRGVQNRLQSLYAKLGTSLGEPAGGGDTINPRARAVALALLRGLINAFELDKEEEKLRAWLDSPRGR